jgi:hypothetical protein
MNTLGADFHVMTGDLIDNVPAQIDDAKFFLIAL